jgi:GNAT superfamily N-acetyltransferase
LVQFRAFRNTDPPQLAEVWRSQTAHRGLMQPMSVAVLERFVFSKPIFDRQGLIVAVDGDRVVGFVHAGFGPAPDQCTLSTELGVTCALMFRPETEPATVAGLLAESEQFLRSRESQVLFGGGNYPLSPFYYGLYGGSELSGVLDTDARTQAVFREHGYREDKRSRVLQRDLATFRPLVDRHQMQIRRHTTFETAVDPATTTWWDACIYEPFDRTQFLLRPREGGTPVATVNFWSMETMTGAWGVHAVGLVGLQVTAQRQRQGLAKYLLGEAFRHLHNQGFAMAEVHVAQENAAALALFCSLGFEQVDQSVLYRKD